MFDHRHTNTKMNILKPPYASFRAISSYGHNNRNADSTRVYEAMLRAAHSYVEMMKKQTCCYVLRTVKKEGIGISSVENLTKRLCSYQGKVIK